MLMNVTLPIYAGTMEEVGGDVFCVLMYSGIFFPFILAGLALIMKVRLYFVFFYCTYEKFCGVVLYFYMIASLFIVQEVLQAFSVDLCISIRIFSFLHL